MKTYTLLINGENVDTGSYEFFPYQEKAILDPLQTRQIIHSLHKGQLPPAWQEYIYARYCISDEKWCSEAIRSAHSASLILRNFPPSKRKKIFDTIYFLLMKNREQLVDLMILEGHPRKLAEWEFSGMENVCREETISYYKSELIKNIASSHSSGERAYCVRKADGVVCVTPPKNAPCSNSIIGAHAILGGNAVIVKPPLRCPISTIFLWTEIVYKALMENGAPPGSVNIVVGNSKLITDQWFASPLVNDLLFFGDSTHGLEIGAKAFQAGKKAILELSGNDMLLVWRDADLENATESLLDGFFGSTQICMVPKKGLIHDDIYEEFESLFLQKVKRLKIGLPTDPETCLTPVTRIPDFFQALDDAIQNGARLLCGGQRSNHEGKPDPQGVFITPAVLQIQSVEQAVKMKCVKEENFFPLIPLIRVNPENPQASLLSRERSIFSKMTGLANSNAYGLRTSVWVKSRPLIYKFLKQLQSSGLLRINSRHVGFSAGLSSHGGTGRSGGPFGEMNYVWQKTTHLQGITVKL